MSKDFKINKLENKKGKITLEIIDNNIDNIEKIELVFSASPIKLKKWVITDSQEIETTVALMKIKKKKKFNEKTFELILN